MKIYFGGENMSKLAQILSMMAAVCLSLAACAVSGSRDEGKTVVVTPAINGNMESLNVGDKLEIKLPTIPTEGFDWQTQDLDTKILVQEGEAIYIKDTDPNSAGGIVTLSFKAVGAGKTNLNLFYVNASSAGAPALSMNSFGMVVEVK
jgi:predicted secreted protein